MADEPREWIKQERTRREFLKIAGIAGATVGLGAGLGGIVAACGGGATTTTGGATTIAGGATTTTVAGATTTTVAGIPHAAGVKLMDEFYTLDQVYWQLWDKGASAACAALGLTHIRVVDNSDVGTQIAAFENAPTQDIHMAITISWNQSSSPQIAKVCNDSKIYLQNVWSNAPWSTPLDAGDYYVSWLTGDDTLAGYTIAKGIFDLMGGKGEFIHVNGPPGNSSGVLRDIGVDKALKEYPNVKMVARQPGGFNRAQSQTVMADLIVGHPNVAGAMGENDDSAIGVWNALKAAKKTNVIVGGVDGIPEMLDLIAAGEIKATVAGTPPWVAGQMVVRAWDAANGWKPTTPERMMYWSSVLINTPAAAKTYSDTIFKALELPFDWAKMSHVLHPNDWDPQDLLIPIDPNVIWGTTPKPNGYTLPAAYATSKSNGEWDKVTTQYKDAFKSGPLVKFVTGTI